jgi:hypothetical protein
MKKEVHKDMKNLIKINQTETLEIKQFLNQINTGEIQQTRTSGRWNLRAEDKIDIKQKQEEILDKRLNNYKRNMQEFSNSIKRPNLQSWALKKQKRCKPKEYVIFSTK